MDSFEKQLREIAKALAFGTSLKKEDWLEWRVADHIAELETLNSQLSNEVSSLQVMSEKLAGEVVKLESSLPAVKGLVMVPCPIVVCVNGMVDSIGEQPYPCGTCKGEGKVPKKCEECEGRGKWESGGDDHVAVHACGTCGEGTKTGHGYATVEEAVVPGMEVHRINDSCLVRGIGIKQLYLTGYSYADLGWIDISDCYLTELAAKLLGKEL